MEEQKKPITTKKDSSQYFVAVGRRKSAVARVRLSKGKGELTVNGKPAEDFFMGEIARVKWQKPYILTGTLNSFSTSIKVGGSGKAAQVDAIVHAISRALIKAETTFRPILKKAGMLTRDPRVRERRKYGLAQKARKGKQSPKR